MDRNISSSPSGVSSSSSDSSIRVSAPIISLRETSENEGASLSDIPSIFSDSNVDHLYNTYHIPRNSFQIFAPSPHVHANHFISAGDTIMVFEEQLKVGLCFPLDSFFFMEVLQFHKLYIA